MRAILISLLVLVVGCASPRAERASRGQTTVLWVSIDGFRHDYLARFQPPALVRLAREGASTTQAKPIFPSLTFPNHIAQVTGTTVDRNGVPSNSFFDRQTGETYRFPHDGVLLRAEPIWATAKQQGIRVACIDWPMSHAQTGPLASDYAWDRYDGQQTDKQRIDRLIEILKNDRGDEPLRLIITYLARVDAAGHRSGPDSPEVEEAVRQSDRIIDRLVQAATEWFDASHRPEDELIVLITTDHGMETVHTLVSLERLVGAELMRGVKVVGAGTLANLYFDEKSEPRIEQVLQKLKDVKYLKACKAADVPARLRYADPTRVGDVVVIVSPGYSLTSQRLAVTQPNFSNTQATHGYDPDECPNMLGASIVWRYRRAVGGHDLGIVENTQWHATVADWLGIKPASGADRRIVKLP